MTIALVVVAVAALVVAAALGIRSRGLAKALAAAQATVQATEAQAAELRRELTDQQAELGRLRAEVDDRRAELDRAQARADGASEELEGARASAAAAVEVARAHGEAALALALARARRSWAVSVAPFPGAECPVAEGPTALHDALAVHADVAREEAGAALELVVRGDEPLEPAIAALLLAVVEEVIGRLAKLDDASQVEVEIGPGGAVVVVAGAPEGTLGDLLGSGGPVRVELGVRGARPGT